LPPSLACTRPSPRVEYKRHGTVSLLAGIDLVTGKVHAWSRTATAAASSSTLKLVDAAYRRTPRSADPRQSFRHISKRRMHGSPPDRVASSSPSRPKHGSWLNLSTALLQVRALRPATSAFASKQELKDRIWQAIDHFTRTRSFTLVYKLKKPPDIESDQGNDELVNLAAALNRQ